MSRVLTLCYGLFSYALFFLTFLYAIAFVGDFAVPLTVDHGRSAPTITAIVVDLVLLTLFAVQHSGMARPGFKRWLTGWLPQSLERSTYVLWSSLALVLLFWQWRPLPAVVWEVRTPWAITLLYAVFALGWGIVLTGTFAINHFDLFGLRQVWLAARQRPYTALPFTEGFYYGLIRHPLMLGFLIAFWAIPRMSLGHLLFAVVSTGYVLIAVRFLEERDLLAMHGEAYREYQRRVPMLCPWPRPRGNAVQQRVKTG